MKLFKKEMLAELQKEIDLEHLLGVINIERTGSVSLYNCPFCDKNSLALHSHDDVEEYYCFDCNAKGGAVDLIMNAYDQSFEDAINFLSILYNVDMNPSEVEKKEDDKSNDHSAIKFRRYEKLADKVNIDDVLELMIEYKKYKINDCDDAEYIQKIFNAIKQVGK